MTELSPEIQSAIQEKAQTLIANPSQRNIVAEKIGISPDELLSLLEKAAQPSSPAVDNHETGFWKGVAVTSVAVLAVIGLMALKGKDK